MSRKSPITLLYSLDARDRIIHVNDAWSKFAAENDGEAVKPELILGETIWSFISDSTLRELYRKLLGKARGGHPVTFDYRCDAPRFHRLFEMQIRGYQEGMVLFSSRLKSQRSRRAVALLELHQARSREYVRMCSWCQRVFTRGRWLPVETAIVELGLMLSPTLPGITHGICRECQEKVEAAIAETGSSG
jgi:hypothetical protein